MGIHSQSTCRISGLLRAAFLWMAVPALVACTTASGPRFTAIDAPSPAHSDVYVYRVDQLYMKGAAFEVTVDGRAVGKLASGTFAVLRLSPGKHRIGVDMHELMGDADLEIYGAPATTQFLQLDFEARGRMASSVLLGPIAGSIINSQSRATLQPRTQGQALDDLTELKNVSASSAMLTLEKDGAYASVDDVDAVPRLDDADKARYREWLQQRLPRVAVVADDGKLFLSKGTTAVSSSAFGSIDAQLQMTMNTCKSSGASGCTVYARNNRVVWVAPKTSFPH